MSELSVLVQEGLGMAVRMMLPLLAAGLVGSLAAGWLGARAGLTDPVAAAVLRGLAVLGMLVLTVDAMTLQARSLAVQAWARLAEVGQGH
ncbi:MAG: hypothetical protein AB1Z98_11725 [Nannocystaceae bacterium]